MIFGYFEAGMAMTGVSAVVIIRLRRISVLWCRLVAQSYLYCGETCHGSVIPLYLFGSDIHRMDLDILEEGSPKHLNSLDSCVDGLAASPNHDFGNASVEQGHARNDIVHRWLLANPDYVWGYFFVFESVVSIRLGQGA